MKLRREENYVRAGDTVIVYFSGQIHLEENALEPHKGKQAFFVTANAQRDNLRFTGIPRDEVMRLLNHSKAARGLLICDACYNGGTRFRSLAELAQVPARVRRSGRQADRPEFSKSRIAVLVADYEFGRAAETHALGHGIFTHALLQGLRGAADSDGDRDGYVTLTELRSYVMSSVNELSNGRQEPYGEHSQDVATALKWRVSP